MWYFNNSLHAVLYGLLCIVVFVSSLSSLKGGLNWNIKSEKLRLGLTLDEMIQQMNIILNFSTLFTNAKAQFLCRFARYSWISAAFDIQHTFLIIAASKRVSDGETA